MSLTDFVPDVSSESDVDSFSGLLEIYRKHGFDAGYHQALRDQLDTLVHQAEVFLRNREALPEIRQVLYAFVAQLERHLHRQSPLLAKTFQDGAGI